MYLSLQNFIFMYIHISTNSYFYRADSADSNLKSVDGIVHHDGSKMIIFDKDSDVEDFQGRRNVSGKKNLLSRSNSFFSSSVETQEDTQISKPYVNNHMGIPFKFEFLEFRLRNMIVHAQDFLNASHKDNEDSDKKAIKLREITMDYKQLNGQVDSNSNSVTSKKLDIAFEGDSKEGSYADEIIDRMALIMMYEVLSKNKLTLASNMFGAAKSHLEESIHSKVR